MSAVFGLLYRDGKPLSARLLQHVQTVLAKWGPDGGDLWLQGSVGLGHLLRHNTPEAIYERQPLKSHDGRFVLTAGARLDNRDELCDLFSVPYPQRSHTPDGALILRAYERWGQDCVEHLIGDWSFALWDTDQRELFLARDHHGNTGLYYYAGERFFAFASALKGLLALPEIPQRPNPLRIAQGLVSWPDQGAPTVYADVMCLPPAHYLTVRPGDQVKVHRYWYLENAPQVRYKSDQEYVDAFLEVYGEAVRCRLRSNRSVGVALSGGLDSGSVAALAARHLGERGRRLSAFTSIPLYDVAGLTKPNRLGDELPNARAMAEHAGNIDLLSIQAEHVSPLAGIQRYLELCQMPGHAAANAYWIDALLQAAQQQGLGTLLTGQGGNASVSWVGDKSAVLRAMLKQGRWGDYVRGFGAWQAYAGLWDALRSYLVRPLLPQSGLLRYRRLRTRLRDGKDPWRAYSAINPEFARELDLSRLMVEFGHDPTFSGFPNSHATRYAIIAPGHSVTGSISMELGAGYDLEVRDPTLDKRVLEFCLGLPEEQYFWRGQNRSLIRRAMHGLMPPKVLYNRRRGLQAADIGHRVVASRDEIQAALEQVAGSELARHYLDLPRLDAVFEAAQGELDADVTVQIGSVLLRGLMVGLFLLRFEA